MQPRQTPIQIPRIAKVSIWELRFYAVYPLIFYTKQVKKKTNRRVAPQARHAAARHARVSHRGQRRTNLRAAISQAVERKEDAQCLTP
jgi:hypothetical protein